MNQNERYSRQIVLPQIGAAGQRRLSEACVTVLGLGALGSVVAVELARAGVGNLRLIDRDYLELSNLQRQALYTEQDAALALPKAVALSAHLREINSQINIQALVVDVTPANITELVDTSDVVCDGTDSFETRQLLNEACVKQNIPWVYGGALGTRGASMAIVADGPCFKCLNPDPLPPGTFGTCATEGVLNMVTATVASIEAAEAIKIILDAPTVLTDLVSFDLWDSSFKRVATKKDDDCPVCAKRIFSLLDEEPDVQPVISLCGVGKYQVTPLAPGNIDIDVFTKQLQAIGTVLSNPYLLRFDGDGVSFTLFKDGRAVIRDVADEAAARSIYAQYIGL
jgi:adenylyltransferase/sulfurtransferase